MTSIKLTSETPTLCYQGDTLVWFSTSGKYNGNGMHAKRRQTGEKEIRNVKGFSSKCSYWYPSFHLPENTQII